MTDAERSEAAAARWLARHDAGPLSAGDAAAFEAWCAADPRHLGAYVRLEAVNARLDRAVALKGMAIEPPRARRWWIPMAAMAATMAAAFGIWQTTAPDAPAGETRHMATRIGEQYRAALADGSTVELNTASAAAVAMAPKLREIRLGKGEALFEVAKDPERPFIVRTALGDVRAIGTVFTVRVDRGLEVLVSEGTVAIERDGEQIARVTAGERYALNAVGDAARAPRDPDEIKRALAWRDGRIAFAGETLAQAAREFNRYNRVQIEIADPAVGTMRFGGYFRATDPEGFGTSIERSLAVTATRRGDTITLSPR